jgi:hypothetical protein
MVLFVAASAFGQLDLEHASPVARPGAFDPHGARQRNGPLKVP